MDTIKQIVAEMRAAVKDADWSQTTGACVHAELVTKWAERLEDALDDMRFDR